MRQRLVFEVTDRELHDGTLTVVGLDLLERVGAVGQERVMAEAGPQLCLRADERSPADDQAPGSKHRLRDLRLPSHSKRHADAAALAAARRRSSKARVMVADGHPVHELAAAVGVRGAKLYRRLDLDAERRSRQWTDEPKRPPRRDSAPRGVVRADSGLRVVAKACGDPARVQLIHGLRKHGGGAMRVRTVDGSASSE